MKEEKGKALLGGAVLGWVALLCAVRYTYIAAAAALPCVRH